MRELIDDTAEQLDKLYRERERLQAVTYTTRIRVERAREHRERVETQIARLEAQRS